MRLPERLLGRESGLSGLGRGQSYRTRARRGLELLRLLRLKLLLIRKGGLGLRLELR